jgi:predicted aconitase with swiveling domain
MKIKGHTVSKGQATGPALVSRDAISFLGGVDPQTGVVIEKGHSLFGRSVKGTVLVFPGGKGSTVGSYLIYQLKKNGVAPVAMINVRAEPIVAVGAIISGILMVGPLSEIQVLKEPQSQSTAFGEIDVTSQGCNGPRGPRSD